MSAHLPQPEFVEQEEVDGVKKVRFDVVHAVISETCA